MADNARGLVNWRPLSEDLAPVQRKLATVLASWEGTPYMVGQQSRGQGVDCVRFVAAVLDEMRGTKTPIKTLPQDAAMHARTQAILAMKKIKAAFEPAALVELDGSAWLEPGDLVVAQPSDGTGGPGHALIAGARPRELWHSTAGRVWRTSWAALLTGPWRPCYLYRPANKAAWLREEGA